MEILVDRISKDKFFLEVSVQHGLDWNFRAKYSISELSWAEGRNNFIDDERRCFCRTYLRGRMHFLR